MTLKLKSKGINKIKPLKREDTAVYNGVYLITNKVNNKTYVGSSKDINRRIKTHKRELAEGSHNNRKLQKDYDKYGDENFEYTILEKDVEHEFLTAYEKYWMYKYNSIVMYRGYNDNMPTLNHKSFKYVYEKKEGKK